MKFIFTLFSIAFLFSSCAPHSTVRKHHRYHDWKQQGPSFPDIGNLGESNGPDCL